MVANTGSDMTGSIYHERQVKELCALHALNNLFQERGFRLGNYDINVIMAALQRRGREAVWFDKRKDPKCLCLDKIEGFILNVPTEYKLGFVLLPLKRRHWIALKKIHGAFYNLDSKLDTPQLIGKDNELLIYLKDQIDSKEKELFLVVSREIDSNQGWLMEPYEIKEDNNTDHDSIRYIEDGYPSDIDVKKSESKEMNENEELICNKNTR
ncbi:josephin-1 isoform X2 [Vespa velutina]|uniref:josephin-1 isoform X2 n=1 Tax=Vespa velutina TaxID=202808 RepID=UPI001FB5110B|nr:josephin-1 isoform X2 [Vespa velutina]